MILPMLEKLKQSFVFGLIIIKVNTDLYHRSVSIHTIFKIATQVLIIDNWEVTLFEKRETRKQLKERETFWQYKSYLF